MADPTLAWHAEALQQRLAALLPGIEVDVVASIASTNSALLSRARGLVNDAASEASPVIVRRSVESGAFGRRAIDLRPALLIAEQQTAGRGRQSRPWQSAPGASLMFSLALPLALADWSGLSLAVGVALSDALDPSAATPRIGLKWPNDLWLMDGPGRGRKLCGVLIETVSAGAQRLAVVGVGLNVAPFDAPAVTTGFASCHELDATLDAPELLARVAPPLVEALLRFEREGLAPFMTAFARRDVLRDQVVCTTSPERSEGIARGVSARGGLLVEAAGDVIDITSGEVSVRLAEQAPC